MLTVRVQRRIGIAGSLWARALPAILLLCAMQARGQIASVQSTGLFGTTAGTSVTSPAFSSTPAVGNTLFLLVWTWTETTSATIEVSDNAGNSYTAVAHAQFYDSGDNWYETASIYTARVSSAKSGTALTIALPNNDGASQIEAVALEYSGVGPVDQSNALTGVTANATVATPAATKYPNELVVSVLGIENPADNFSSIAASSGYTIAAYDTNNSGDTAGAAAVNIATAAAVQSNTWTVNPGMTQWAAVIAAFSPSNLTVPNHYDVSTPGSAVNCAPAAVTVSAHTSTHTALATTDTIALSTSSGHGDWTLTSGKGTFTAGASNSGTASYTYAAGDNGTAVFALRDTYPETVTINVTDGTVTAKSGTAMASEDSPLTFAASGFRITNGANVGTTIATQTSGVTSTQTLALQAVQTNTSTGACTAVFASGATVNVGLAYQCNNPATCVAGQTLALTNNGVTTNLAGNPASSLTSYTPVALKFSTANAEAPFTIDYTDAGQITLAARYAIPLGSGAASGNTMTGAGQFVVQPYTLKLSSIKGTTSGAANPGASSASGAVFIGAGQPFTATVTASNYQGNATPNFGQEIPTANVTLTTNLVLPASGHNPALSGAFGSYTSGSSTGTGFSWPEVGVITLTPIVTSYLGSGTVTGTSSGNVGRFVPNNLAVALNTPVFGTACSAGSFTYVGQPFTYTVAPVITATAQALGGATTQNYTGPLMRLSNSSLTGRTYTPTPASPTLTVAGLPPTSIDPAIADLGTGQVTLTFSAGSGLSFTRGGAIAPFSANIALSENVIDLDGVTAPNPVTFGSGSGVPFSTGASQYYGRLALRDSLGSELLDLPVPLTTQFYLNSSAGFTTNTADSCTLAPGLAFSSYQLNLSSGKTCVRDSGSPGVSGVGCAAASSSPYSATAAAGNFNLILAAPGSGNNGAVTVTAAAPAYLQYLWSVGSGVSSSPSGVATFGLFPGPASRTHQREVY